MGAFRNCSIPAIIAPLVFVMFAVSCTSSQHKAETEHEAEPNPFDESTVQTSAAKSTGTTFLTNIKEIGIFNTAGRVTCMVIDRANSNHIIAGAHTGGLWTSSNGGITWAPVDDHLPTLNIISLCQNPLQTTTYYASTYTLMSNGTIPVSYRPDIYKSTDGGRTFQLLPSSAGAFTLVKKVVCSPLDRNTVFAICDAFSGLDGVYRSQDNGATWTKVHALSQVGDLEILPDGTVLVSAQSQVFRSPNGSPNSFTLSNAGLTGPNTFSAIDIAFCQSQPNVVYGVTTGGNTGVGVFKSVDKGQSWSFVQALNTGQFTRALAVKPDDPAFVFAGSVGLFLSRNSAPFGFYGVGGVDWWSVNFDPNDPDRVFMTFDQGVVEVGLNPFNPNNNTAYKTRDSLFNCAQVYAGDCFSYGDRVIVGMQDLGTSQVFDNGREQGVGSGDGGSAFFHKQDTTIAYGTYQNGQIFKKTKLHIPPLQPGATQPVSILNQLDADNNGTVDEGGFFVQPFWMNNADGEQLYFPTRKRLWRSTNGGASWQPVSASYTLPPDFNTVIMDGNHKANPVVYWSVGDMLYVLPNAKTGAAANVFTVKLPAYLSFIRVDPANDSFVYITTAPATGGRVYRSGNLFKGNVQWADITGDLPSELYIRCIEVNPKNHDQLLVGTGAGLYASADGGTKWLKELQFPNVNVGKSNVRPSDNRVFLYTLGRGVWAATFPLFKTSVDNNELRKQLVVWPNPATDIIHIAIPALYPNSSIHLYAADGRLLKQVKDIQHTPYALSLAGLPPGHYTITLLKGDQPVGTARVIKS